MIRKNKKPAAALFYRGGLYGALLGGRSYGVETLVPPPGSIAIAQVRA
jgi:hypothetical protein